MKHEAVFTIQGEQDFQWLVAHSQELREQYPDRWVAVYNGQIVGVGESGEAALRMARDRLGPGCRPVVKFVEGGAYVYQGTA